MKRRLSMRVSTGELISNDDYNNLSKDTKKDYISVKRELTEEEIEAKRIKMESPCGCGSKKMFKDCHFRKPSPLTLKNRQKRNRKKGIC
jgi:hypothetical protein